MGSIEQGVKEVKSVVLSLYMVEIYLDALMLFIVSLLVLAVLTLPWYLAVYPALLFFAYHTYKTVTRFSYALIEEKVPELHEALRTVVDHLGERSQIMEELCQDVLTKLKHVRSSYFLGFSDISKQLIAMAVLSFAVVLVGSTNVYFEDVGGYFGNGGGLLRNYELEGLPSLARGNESDIYGDEESVLPEGSEDLPIELTPIENSVDLSSNRDVPPAQFRDTYPATDVGAAASDAYADQIPRKYQGLVKDYFKSIPQ